jgi:hypothetical protein
VQPDGTGFILALVTEVGSVFDYLIGFFDHEGTAGLSIGLHFHQSRCCVWFQRSGVLLMLVVIPPLH